MLVTSADSDECNFLSKATCDFLHHYTKLWYRRVAPVHAQKRIVTNNEPSHSVTAKLWKLFATAQMFTSLIIVYTDLELRTISWKIKCQPCKHCHSPLIYLDNNYLSILNNWKMRTVVTTLTRSGWKPQRNSVRRPAILNVLPCIYVIVCACKCVHAFYMCN